MTKLRFKLQSILDSCDFQIMFLARLEGASPSEAYTEYVVEEGRLITQSKNSIWEAVVGRDTRVALTWRMLKIFYQDLFLSAFQPPFLQVISLLPGDFLPYPASFFHQRRVPFPLST